MRKILLVVFLIFIFASVSASFYSSCVLRMHSGVANKCFNDPLMYSSTPNHTNFDDTICRKTEYQSLTWNTCMSSCSLRIGLFQNIEAFDNLESISERRNYCLNMERDIIQCINTSCVPPSITIPFVNVACATDTYYGRNFNTSAYRAEFKPEVDAHGTALTQLRYTVNYVNFKRGENNSKKFYNYLVNYRNPDNASNINGSFSYTRNQARIERDMSEGATTFSKIIRPRVRGLPKDVSVIVTDAQNRTASAKVNFGDQDNFCGMPPRFRNSTIEFMCNETDNGKIDLKFRKDLGRQSYAQYWVYIEIGDKLYSLKNDDSGIKDPKGTISVLKNREVKKIVDSHSKIEDNTTSNVAIARYSNIIVRGLDRSEIIELDSDSNEKITLIIVLRTKSGAIVIGKKELSKSQMKLPLCNPPTLEVIPTPKCLPGGIKSVDLQVNASAASGNIMKEIEISAKDNSQSQFFNQIENLTTLNSETVNITKNIEIGNRTPGYRINIEAKDNQNLVKRNQVINVAGNYWDSLDRCSKPKIDIAHFEKNITFQSDGYYYLAGFLEVDDRGIPLKSTIIRAISGESWFDTVTGAILNLNVRSSNRPQNLRMPFSIRLGQKLPPSLDVIITVENTSFAIDKEIVSIPNSSSIMKSDAGTQISCIDVTKKLVNYLDNEQSYSVPTEFSNGYVSNYQYRLHSGRNEITPFLTSQNINSNLCSSAINNCPNGFTCNNNCICVPDKQTEITCTENTAQFNQFLRSQNIRGFVLTNDGALFTPLKNVHDSIPSLIQRFQRELQASKYPNGLIVGDRRCSGNCKKQPVCVIDMFPMIEIKSLTCKVDSSNQKTYDLTYKYSSGIPLSVNVMFYYNGSKLSEWHVIEQGEEKTITIPSNENIKIDFSYAGDYELRKYKRVPLIVPESLFRDCPAGSSVSIASSASNRGTSIKQSKPWYCGIWGIGGFLCSS